MVDGLDGEENPDEASVVGCGADDCPLPGLFEFVTVIGGMKVVTRFCRAHYDEATDPRVVQEIVMGDPREVKDQ